MFFTFMNLLYPFLKTVNEQRSKKCILLKKNHLSVSNDNQSYKIFKMYIYSIITPM